MHNWPDWLNIPENHSSGRGVRTFKCRLDELMAWPAPFPSYTLLPCNLNHTKCCYVSGFYILK